MLREKPRPEHAVRANGILSSLRIGRQTKRSRQRSPVSVRALISAAVVMLLASAANAGLISNGNFSSVSPSIPDNGICTTNPAKYPAVDPGAYPACTASGWTGSYELANGSAIGVFGVTFGVPQPFPGGGNALALQAEYDLLPTASQTINLPSAGDYTLTFYAVNRGAPAANAGPQTVSVLLDDALIAGGTFAKLPFTWTEETLTVDTTAGSHTLTFEGLDETTKVTTDNVAAFIGDVSLNPTGSLIPTPEPSTFALLGLTFIGIGAKALCSQRCKRR